MVKKLVDIAQNKQCSKTAIVALIGYIYRPPFNNREESLVKFEEKLNHLNLSIAYCVEISTMMYLRFLTVIELPIFMNA